MSNFQAASSTPHPPLLSLVARFFDHLAEVRARSAEQRIALLGDKVEEMSELEMHNLAIAPSDVPEVCDGLHHLPR